MKTNSQPPAAGEAAQVSSALRNLAVNNHAISDQIHALAFRVWSIEERNAALVEALARVIELCDDADADEMTQAAAKIAKDAIAAANTGKRWPTIEELNAEAAALEAARGGNQS